MVAEIVGGWIADSIVIMNDAAHMLTDVAAMLLALFSIWLAQRPPNKKMTYGYHRAEILGALFSLVLIWFLVGVLGFEAVNRLIAFSNHDPSLEAVDGKVVFIIGVLGLGEQRSAAWMSFVLLLFANARCLCWTAVVNVVDALILSWGNRHKHFHTGEDLAAKDSNNPSPVHHHSSAVPSTIASNSVSQTASNLRTTEQQQTTPAPSKHTAKRQDRGNVNIKAAMVHVFGDTAQSVGVIIAAILIWAGNPEQDPFSSFNLADPIAALIFGAVTLLATCKR
jgi:zinc transporter 2